MQTKHFTVSTVILVTIVFALQTVRGQDCDPTTGCNEQSFCVSNGYCSCLSGFSGDSCLIQPQSSCSSSYKDPSSINSISNSLLEYYITQNSLNIQINASLEKNRFNDSSSIPLKEGKHDSTYSLGTTITWSESSSCEYPSSVYWTKANVVDGLCIDSYLFKVDINEAISFCGFVYDSKSNTWSNNITITRYYSQPPDMTIMDPSRRIEGRPRISIETKTFSIILPSTLKPTIESTSSDSSQEDTSSQQSEEEIDPSTSITSSDSSNGKENMIKLIAAICGVVLFGFIIAIIAITVIRKRQSRNAQAQFNFEGIDSN